MLSPTCTLNIDLFNNQLVPGMQYFLILAVIAIKMSLGILINEVITQCILILALKKKYNKVELQDSRRILMKIVFIKFTNPI